jgi:hypothetical protein
MGRLNILDNLECKKKRPDELVGQVIKDPKLIPSVIEGTSSSKGSVKFGATKILRLLSEQKPEILYPHMDHFIEQLDDENNIIKWNAQDIIANLIDVDTDKKFDTIFDKYYSLISDEVMITAGHVVDNSGKIALSKPQFQNEITKHLLSVDKINRDPECNNILIGKAILSFEKYFKEISKEEKHKIISFVKNHSNNSRNATKKKAEKFLTRFEKGFK